MNLIALFNTYWFDLTQTTAIVVGFVFTALGYSLESRYRRAEFTLQATAAHRKIWSTIHSNPELGRILDPNREIDLEPVSESEDAFLLTVLLHLASIHQASLLGLYPDSPEMIADIRRFFSLPAPRRILTKYRPFQSQEFSSFLEKVLS